LAALPIRERHRALALHRARHRRWCKLALVEHLQLLLMLPLLMVAG
jgi:hypothetical protein